MNKKSIQLLQVLRAYGAISVFACHFLGDYEYNFVKMDGQLGVAVFFVISGYLLVLTSRYKDIKFFLLKKAIRIVPLYYALTLGVVILGIIKPAWLKTGVVTPTTVLKSFFFLPNRIPGTGYVQPLLLVGWTLYYEVFVYLAFFLFLLVLKNEKRAGIGTSLFLVVLHFIYRFSGIDNLYLSEYGGIVVLYFAAGMLIAIGIPIREKSKKANGNILVCTMGLALFLLGEQFYGSASYMSVLLVGGIFALLLHFFGHAKFAKPYLLVGDMSFSIYLIHYFIVKFFNRVLGVANNPALCILNFGICFLITCCISYFSWRYVEVKFGKYIRGKAGC